MWSGDLGLPEVKTQDRTSLTGAQFQVAFAGPKWHSGYLLSGWELKRWGATEGTSERPGWGCTGMLRTRS